jgi:hypothetical protein
MFLLIDPFALCSLKGLELTVIRGIPQKGISLIDVSLKPCPGLYLRDVRLLDLTVAHRGVPNMRVPVPFQSSVFING